MGDPQEFHGDLADANRLPEASFDQLGFGGDALFLQTLAHKGESQFCPITWRKVQ